MGAFLGYGDIGVWATNRERDAFLDWFAEHRCSKGNTRWEYCMNEAQRWTGRCIDLGEFLKPDEIIRFTDDEYKEAAVEFWPEVAQLVRIIDAITRREWRIRIDSVEATSWRKPSDPTQLSFGDNVSVRDTDLTRARGLAGLRGQVYGVTTPSATGVVVIGESTADIAFNVHFKALDQEFWFAPELLQFIDHGPALPLT
jgi:hypothetical protein